jgi:putative oxidoreductase
MTFLSRYASQIHGLFRIVAGLLFLEHGTQKLFAFPPLPPEMAAMHVPDNFKPVLLTAAVIELVGGALVTLGFYSRWIAFICSGEMAIGYWLAHAFARHSLFPATNAGDAAVLFCFGFLFLAAAGPGRFAVNDK